MSRRRAALAALLLAAVAATVPGGCTNRADDTSGGGGISLPSFPSVELRMDSVVMVGDSITEGSAIVLQDTLTTAGFSDVVVDGDARPVRWTAPADLFPGLPVPPGNARGGDTVDGVSDARIEHLTRAVVVPDQRCGAGAAAVGVDRRPILPVEVVRA